MKKQTEKNVNKKKAQRRKWKDVRGGRRRPLLLCIEPRIKKKWGDDEERKEIHVYVYTKLAAFARWEALLADDQSIAAST